MLRLALITVSALWSAAIFGMSTIEWNVPGDASNQRFELYNRAVGLLFAVFSVLLFLLHSRTLDQLSKRGDKGLLVAAFGAAIMSVGSIIEFWLPLFLPQIPPSFRSFGWMIYCAALLFFYAGGALLGRDLLRSRGTVAAGWMLLAAWLPLTLAVAGLSRITAVKLPPLAIGTCASGLAYILLALQLESSSTKSRSS